VFKCLQNVICQIGNLKLSISLKWHKNYIWCGIYNCILIYWIWRGIRSPKVRVSQGPLKIMLLIFISIHKPWDIYKIINLVAKNSRSCYLLLAPAYWCQALVQVLYITSIKLTKLWNRYYFSYFINLMKPST